MRLKKKLRERLLADLQMRLAIELEALGKFG